jgi:hypothetical protein
MIMFKKLSCLTVAMIGITALITPQLGFAAQPWNPDPFQTPARYYDAADFDLSDAELMALRDTCVADARASFPEAIERFRTGLPSGAVFSVVAPAPTGQFYVDVDQIVDDVIQGRMVASTYVAGRAYAKGDSYELSTSEILDWLIIYPDRPEEGNLVGKYIIRLADGLVSGPCDAQHPELTRFRVYQPGYSFMPPVTEGWILEEGNRDADVSAQRIDESLDTIDTAFAGRLRVRKRAARMTIEEFADYIEEMQREELGHPDRFTLLEHEVTPLTGQEQRCVAARQVIEDREALSPSGERSLKIREIMDFVCFHPGDDRTVVRLTYVHTHPVDQGRADFQDEAFAMFETLSFSEFETL